MAIKIATAQSRHLSNSAKHYLSHTSSSYDSAFFYSPGKYTSFLCDKVKQTLGIIPTSSISSTPGGSSEQQQSDGDHNRRCRLLDIGGGTGTFTKMIIEDVPEMNAVVLDPYLTNNTDIPDDDSKNGGTTSRVYFVKGTAEEFNINIDNNDNNSTLPLWWRNNNHYHQCLMKEVIHHIPEKDRENIFRGIFTALLPTPIKTPTATHEQHQHNKNINPSLLIITRPQHDIDYPLWPEAKEVWAKNQPSVEGIETDLSNAGFSHVRHHIVTYPCSIELNKWKAMVKGRFWSTFSNFTDEELTEACDNSIANSVTLDLDGNISFEDRLLFITAVKIV